jgi:predicted nucleic-acid-binding Zn-ribbon protein
VNEIEKIFDVEEKKKSNKELDIESLELKNKCPKCGFEYE